MSNINTVCGLESVLESILNTQIATQKYITSDDRTYGITSLVNIRSLHISFFCLCNVANLAIFSLLLAKFKI